MAEGVVGVKRGWGDEAEEHGHQEAEEDEQQQQPKKRMTEKTFGERQELQAYERLVIKVKELVDGSGGKLPDLKQDMTRRKCLVCQVHWFHGWKGLMDHARTFARRKMQEHRGYHRALLEVLSPPPPPPPQEVAETTESEKPETESENKTETD